MENFTIPALAFLLVLELVWLRRQVFVRIFSSLV